MFKYDAAPVRSAKAAPLTLMTYCLLMYPVATWVGGAFIVGLAEMVYSPDRGLIGAIVLIAANSASFIIGKTLIPADRTLFVCMCKKEYEPVWLLVD